MMFRSKAPKEWKLNDVTDWLHSFEFDQYIPNFQEEKITGDFLLQYVNDEEIMKELGILKRVQRKRLEFELEKIIKEQLLVTPSNLLIPSKKTTTKRKKSNSHIENVDSSSLQSESEDLFQSETNKDQFINPPLKKQKIKKKTSTGKKTVTKQHLNQNNDQKNKQQNLSENYVDLPIILFQIALSNRSKCRNCEEIIGKDTIKLGVISFFNRGGKLLPYHNWFHPLCGLSIVPPTVPRETPIEILDGEIDDEKNDEENDDSNHDLQLEPITTCKYCKKFFSEVEQNTHEHSYFLKVGLKKRELLCHYCATHSLSSEVEGGVRLTADLIQQVEGFQETSEENQTKIIKLLSN